MKTTERTSTRPESIARSNDDFMDFKDAAKYLRLSESYLYKKTSANEIPFYKPGGKKLYFFKRDLDAWVASKPNRTKEQIEEVAKKLIGFGMTGTSQPYHWSRDQRSKRKQR
jgi:excisionase family DNA binding protein